MVVLYHADKILFLEGRIVVRVVMQTIGRYDVTTQYIKG